MTSRLWEASLWVACLACLLMAVACAVAGRWWYVPPFLLVAKHGEWLIRCERWMRRRGYA